MKSWLIRAVLFVTVLEILYLGVVNLALNLPWTQTLINQSRPEKFAVHWDSAWSWYPFRVHARGISVNGQSSSQQWQVESPGFSASISILALLRRSVNIRHGDIRDIKYHQRPRPRPDKKYAALREFFPNIKNRKINDPATAKALKKKGRPWKINLADIHARGRHRIWLYQLQSAFQGDIQTDFTFQTRGGPLSLSNGRVDLTLDTLIINGNREVAGQGHLKGAVEMSPFVPSKNKGVKILAFLKAAVEIGAETESLAYLNLYLSGFHGMKVDGAGKLSGRLAVENGKLKPGTNLAVAARELTMDLLSYRSEGAGNIIPNVKPDRPNITHVAIEFGKLQAFHADSREPLLSGEGLSVNGRGAVVLVPMDSKTPKARYLAVTIPSVKVPDLRLYQRFLPDRWAFKLHGGQGELLGKAEVSNTGFDIYMKLAAEDADAGLKNYRFTTNLDMAVKAVSPTIPLASIDIAGTYIRLNHARLSNRQQKKTDTWHASLAVEKGMLKLNLPEDIPKNADIRQLLAVLKGKEAAALLKTGKDKLKLNGKISDLRWLNLLLKNPYNMAIHGAGEVTADVCITSGWLGN